MKANKVSQAQTKGIAKGTKCQLGDGNKTDYR